MSISIFLCALTLLGPASAGAQAGPPLDAASLPADLTELPLEELLRIDVTSVSKKSEPLFSAAAAVFVLSGEEIRRAGVRSIAEALRLVPGLEVARNFTQEYAVSARGFNSIRADKLEVLLDGRSVYTPLFSGVFWNLLDPYLADIDRIEVIRGPGAALWGANAVNGVINIVTRPARATQGSEVSAGAGTEELAFGAARSGGTFGDTGHFRAWAKTFDRDSDGAPAGGEAQDGYAMQHVGARADWAPAPGYAATVSGDVFHTSGTLGARHPVTRGGNLLGRVACCSVTETWSAQLYVDHSDITVPDTVAEIRDTADLELQYRLPVFARQDVTVGAGYRVSADRTGGPPNGYIFLPQERTLHTLSAFVQDQVRFPSRGLALTVGTKLEHNDYTGFEVQPSVRLGWDASPRLFGWGAVSRAVRTPNRVDSDFAVYCPPPSGLPPFCGPGSHRVGNPDLQAEVVIAYEGGLRFKAMPDLSFDLALFDNDYRRLKSVERAPPFGAFDNKLRGRSTGAELSVAWQAREGLALNLFYDYLRENLTPLAGSSDMTSEALREGSDPRHQAGVRAAWTPAPRWQINGFARYVGALDAFGIPAYTELNLRAARRVGSRLELAVVGDNLLHDRHAEFGRTDSRGDPQRSVLLEARWAWR